MSYQKGVLKKTHDGKTLVQLSVAKQILKIRDKIEANAQHAGPELELVYQAYKEIQEAHGHYPPKLDPTCSGCIAQMNKMIQNWFRIFDQGSVLTKAKNGGVEAKPLKPVKDEPKELPSMKPPTTSNKEVEDDELDEEEETNEETSGSSNDISKMKYGELVKKFNKIASKKEREEINDGKPPKKSQIIEFLNKRS